VIRGASLAELLVALSLLLVTSASVLAVYVSARRSHALGERLVEQQQAARVALHRITADLRMAGFNVHPDGDRSRPDEAIEAACATAVVLRADLDSTQPAATMPEAELARAGSFRNVSTGNDEIVAYVLARAGSRDALRYRADVLGSTRDGVTEEVRVERVALSHDRPPYTLYRVTLDDAGAPVRAPLADRVSALRFRYFDRGGLEIPPPGGGESADERAARARIARVAVELECWSREGRAAAVEPETGHPLRLVTQVRLRNPAPTMPTTGDEETTLAPGGGR
jgi:hypothetical protein